MKPLILVVPSLVLTLSLLIDLLDGERRDRVCPIHPVRVCWLLGSKIMKVFKLKNKISHGVLLWFLTVVPLVLVYSVIPIYVTYTLLKPLSKYFHGSLILILTYVVVCSSLLKFTFSYRLLRWYVDNIINMFRSNDKGRARALLQEIVRRDVFSLHSEGLILSALIETYFESILDGVISPLFWYSLFDLVGAYTQRLANTMDSLVGYRYAPFDKIGYFSAKVDSLMNSVPSRILSFTLRLVCPSSRGRKSEKSIIKGSIGVNALRVFTAVSSCLGVRLEKCEDYTIGDPSWVLPDLSHVEQSVNISVRALLIVLVILSFLCVVRQIVFLMVLRLLF